VAGIIETALESDEHCKKCPYEGGGFEQGALSLLRECPYQSERNKVLDEVIEFLKSKQNISPFTELYYHAAIEEIDKELRQAGEP